MDTKLILVPALLIASFLTSCDNQSKTANSATEEVKSTSDKTKDTIIPVNATDGDSAEGVMTSGSILLRESKGSPEYLDAMLEMNVPTNNAEVKPGKVQLQYDVRNFQLGAQTAGVDKGVANSEKGQHIHLIKDNEPYIALYEPNHTVDLKEGNHVILSFLSRSYHESVKNPAAYVLRQVKVGNPKDQSIDTNAPHMFYSRPKGEYKGDETQSVLLDFYLVNANLSQEGYKVRATINGEEFVLTKWVGYHIEGLPMGESSIKLELLDADGNLVKSPYNPVERKITLSKPTS